MQISVNGHDTFVATGGRDFDPTLPAVVMIHGAGFDSSTWLLQSRWFAHHGYALLAPDLPGHGRSKGEALTGIPAMADLRKWFLWPLSSPINDGEVPSLIRKIVDSARPRDGGASCCRRA